MRKKVFISKVFQMSAVMLLLNISNICYSIFISKRAGASGIGMFHLIMSVYSLGVTFSVSGIGLTATRLISDMPSPLAVKCADSVVIKCIRVCLTSSSLAFLAMFFSADFIAEKIFSDKSCAICLKLMSPTLLFTAVSSVINGYFTAFGRVGSISFARIVSDCCVWTSALYFLNVYPQNQTYMAVVIAFCVGVVSECLCNLFLWKRSQCELYCKKGTDYKSILKLCTPLAIGSYLRTGLVSAENMLIPVMLSVFGVSDSVAAYGIIKGMTLPVLMFPTVFTGAFTSLIVPEIARRRTLGYKNSIKYISGLSVEYMLKFAVLISAIYIKWHRGISMAFFSEQNAAVYLGMLSVLPIFLFFDSVVDSILKGMDEQVTSLKINIVDSICRVVLILFLIPHFGMIAYIGIMYLSEITNLFFSYLKLKKVTGVHFPFKNGLFLPVMSAAITFLAFKFFAINGTWSAISLFAAIYISVLSFISSFFKE